MDVSILNDAELWALPAINILMAGKDKTASRTPMVLGC